MRTERSFRQSEAAPIEGLRPKRGFDQSDGLDRNGFSSFVSPRVERFAAAHRTPAGIMRLVSDGDALVELRLPSDGPFDDLPISKASPRALRDAGEQLDAFLAGSQRNFSLTLAPSGTPFQLSVWHALLGVGYGDTASYGEIAQAVGRPKAPRAVGGANHVNPIAIVIPCHRIVGSNGSLTGYGGGLPLKSALLELERCVLAGEAYRWEG